MSTTLEGREVVRRTENLAFVRGNGQTIRTFAESCPLCSRDDFKHLPAHVRRHCPVAHGLRAGWLRLEGKTSIDSHEE